MVIDSTQGEPGYGFDRPQGVVTYSCSAYGVKFEVKAFPELFTYLPSLIPGSQLEKPEADPAFVFGFDRISQASGQTVFRVDEDGVPIFFSEDAGVAARALESRVHQQLASLADRVVFVHAGVVAWRGQGIVLPGPSHAGKSTLVAALVAAGATYYSDEYAVFGPDGRIHAFTRELRLRPDIADPAVSQTDVPLDQSLPPLQARWILNVRHRPESRWDPNVLTPGQSLLALLENSVAVRRQPEMTLKVLKLAVSSAIGLQSDRGEAATAARNIVYLIDKLSSLNAGPRGSN